MTIVKTVKLRYHVYRPDGSYLGDFRVSMDKRRWYQARGFTFEGWHESRRQEGQGHVHQLAGQ
jgi:hypothetical protein